MAWIESNVDLADHPKTIRLMATLDIDVQKAVGALTLLWHYTFKYAWRDGDLTKYGAVAVARGARWEGDPAAFVQALQQCGFLDGLKIHDWLDCAGRLVTDRIYNEKRRSDAVKTPVNGDLRRKTPNMSSYQPTYQPNQPTNSKTRAPRGAAGFEVFWAAYPKKKAKGDAEKAWKKVNPDKPLQQRILEAVARFRMSPDWLKEGGQFIPYPATWLNGKRWEDEISTVGGPDGKKRSADYFSVPDEQRVEANQAV